jgi:crotonobetainyl-CoA:carnitine CoA-transferase CaiB-like acyl-CoA transferase
VAFCARVLERPEIATDPRFVNMAARRESRAALTAMIEDRFSGMTSVEAAALLDRAGIANGRLNQPIDAWNHEQFAARDRWREIDTEAGPVRGLLPPFTFADHEAATGAVPSVGQHTDAVLAEIGFTTERVAAMRAAGAA